MAARRSRRGSKGKGNAKKALIAAGALLAIVLLLGSGIFKSSGSTHGKGTVSDFRVSDYRRDGSRFASSGNVYVFDGRVENIETLGDDRIVMISIPNNPDERLPLLVPGSTHLRVNLTRGDRFIFETTCRTGMSPDGGQVKGVLIVKNARSK